MPTYFVGPGGNNANSGLSWALRKATLNGAEDIPLVSGDEVIVGPGTYRETLTVDVSGGSLYTTGTVAVTQGSKIVTGTGTTFTGNVFANGQFQIRGLTLTSYVTTFADSPYEIESVDSNTQITLKKEYQGPTATGASYRTWRDIKYIGDRTGELTDGIGGQVRITGSDNDQTATRANCITSTTRDYRTWRGFSFDTCTGVLFNETNSVHNGFIIEDCTFLPAGSNSVQINIAGTGGHQTVRRCFFFQNRTTACNLSVSTVSDNSENLVESCVFVGITSSAVAISRYGGVRVRNCHMIGCGFCVRVATAPNVGQTNFAHNNIFSGGSAAAQGATAVATNEDLMENYNNFFANSTDRTNCNVGANSTAYQPLYQMPLLLNNGRMEPWNIFQLQAASGLRDIAGSNPAPYDLWGVVRGTVGVNGSWGGVQSQPLVTRNDNAGDIEWKIGGRGKAWGEVLVQDNTAYTITVKVRWDDNANMGIKPSVKLLDDYGVSVAEVFATGTGGEETLTVGPFTPQVGNDRNGIMILELRNNCTHSSDIAVYYDDLTVS